MKKVIALTMLVLLIGTIRNSVKAEGNTATSEQLSFTELIASKYQICPELIQSVIEHESTWNEYAENSGCLGLMQISERFHYDRMDKLGAYDLYNWRDNISVGTDYIAELIEEYGDIYLVLMIYNGTSNAESKWANGEYSEYAMSVAKRSAELEREHGK